MAYQKSGKLNIVAAVWGLEVITTRMRGLVKDGPIESLQLNVTNEAIGLDGWVGQIKSLTVVYNYDGGTLYIASVKEGNTLLINGDVFTDHEPAEQYDAGEQKLSVMAATYGVQNVTGTIRSLIEPGIGLSFPVENTVLGDGWPGIAKTLVLVLGIDNVVTDVWIFLERQHCTISLDNIVAALS